MKRVLVATAVLFALTVGASFAAQSHEDDAPKGQPVPFHVFPIETFGAAVNDWADESLPHYSIMHHAAEWENAFKPVNNGKPFHPNPSVFEKAQLISISRVSAPPAAGQPVLKVKSAAIVDGELVLSYSFIPPAGQSGRKMKNTIIVALPANIHNPLRISEDTETAGSMAALAEYEEAVREGRFKVEAPQQR